MTEQGRAPSTRAALVRAAERLFADRGIEAVSLREIMREAGQRNTNSLQYHFGDRAGLLRAVFDKHIASVSLRRLALLDMVRDRHGAVTMREAASILVRPLVAKLGDRDGGPEFLQIAGQIVNTTEKLITPDEPLGPLIFDDAGSMQQWVDLVDPLMPPGTAGPPLHRRYAAVRFMHLELARRARLNPEGDQSLFLSHLTDLVCALLATELSPETSALVRRREERRGAEPTPSATRSARSRP